MIDAEDQTPRRVSLRRHGGEIEVAYADLKVSAREKTLRPCRQAVAGTVGVRKVVASGVHEREWHVVSRPDCAWIVVPNSMGCARGKRTVLVGDVAHDSDRRRRGLVRVAVETEGFDLDVPSAVVLLGSSVDRGQKRREGHVVDVSSVLESVVAVEVDSVGGLGGHSSSFCFPSR